MLIPKRNPLRRYYGEGDLHFITSSCYRRRPLLGSARARDVFLDVFEQIRRRYQFDVIGFVVMPEHVHLLISEPEKANPSVVMQVLKQKVARRLLRKARRRNAAQAELWKEAPDADRFWQRRFYDFNVFSEAKRIEKLQYMHHNPVKRGLVDRAELWAWSSYRVHAFGEHGRRVEMDWLFPPFVFRKPKSHSGNATGMGNTHPSKPAKSAAPTFRNPKTETSKKK